jgi:cytochrome b6
MWAYDWSEERLEIQCIGDDILGKYVPPHVNVFYCFGGIVLVLFLCQVVTGLGLTLYYSATVVSGFPSVLNLVGVVYLGWLNRSIHRWCGSCTIVTMILHILRVYLTGGLKKARELIWITGVLLGVCTVTFGVTGYSLAWDQVGYWACKIVTGVPESLDELAPGTGLVLVLTIRGGFSVSSGRLSRFYSIHTLILPVITLTSLGLHFSMLRKQGISGPL